MTIHITLSLQAKPDAREQLVNTLEAILPDTRDFKGCQKILVTSNEDEPLNLVVLEKWDTRADHESYTAWRAERGDLAKLGGLLACPPESKYLETVDI